MIKILKIFKRLNTLKCTSMEYYSLSVYILAIGQKPIVILIFILLLVMYDSLVYYRLHGTMADPRVLGPTKPRDKYSVVHDICVKSEYTYLRPVVNRRGKKRTSNEITTITKIFNTFE